MGYVQVLIYNLKKEHVYFSYVKQYMEDIMQPSPIIPWMMFFLTTTNPQ